MFFSNLTSIVFSEVYQYDMSGDSTLPSAGKKRKAQADDSTPKASKKIKSDPDTLTPETSETPKSSKKHKKVKKEPKSEPEDEINGMVYINQYRLSAPIHSVLSKISCNFVKSHSQIKITFVLLTLVATSSVRVIQYEE